MSRSRIRRLGSLTLEGSGLGPRFASATDRNIATNIEALPGYLSGGLDETLGIDRETGNGPPPRPLERAAELSAIEAALERAADRRGGLLILAGPPGIGKTTLLEEARARAAAGGLEALFGAGAELERGFGFGVARQLLEGALVVAGGERRAELLSGAAALAAPVLGLEPDPGPAAEPGAMDHDYGPLHGLYWLVANLAERRPLLLAVDDAQWADPASLRFLAFLSRRLEGLPVLLALTVREKDPGSAAGPLGAMLTDPRATVLHPRPLSADASSQLLARRLGREPAPEFANACQEATRGNPYLLAELATELDGEGIEPTSANAARVTRLGPRNISRAVLGRLSALGPAALALAKAIAVLGDGAALDDATSLAELPRESAAAAADALAGAAIIEASVALSFAHPIVRSAIYAEIPPHERAARHRAAARLLAARGAEPEAVATQLLATDPAGDPWAVEHLRAAARRSRERGGPLIAIELLRRALAEPPAEEERAELMHAAGSAAVSAGQPDGIEMLSEARRIARDPELRARITTELGGALLYLGRGADAARVLAGTLEELAEGSVAAAELEAVLLVAAATTGSAHRIAGDRLRTAEARAGALPDRTARALLAPLALDRATAGGSAADTIRLAERALDRGRLLRERGADSPIPYVAIAGLLWADEPHEAERHLGAAIELARAAASARGFALASAARAVVRLRCGELSGAEADARANLELSAGAAWPAFRILAVAALAGVLVERGERQEAGAVLSTLDAIPHDPAAVLVQPLHEARARLELAAGEPGAALEALASCRLWERRCGAASVAPVPWRSLAAEAGLALGERSEALRLASEELEIARGFGAPRAIGVALRAHGLAERGERGVELLREAAAILEPSPDRLERARALVDLGSALRRLGTRTEAREQLRAGLEVARGCGATALVARGYEELEAAGSRPRRILRSGLDELTASERRVAAMAAEGLSNREIAQRLFVTVRTVEAHLSHAYRKLEIASRKELGAALAQGARLPEVAEP